MRNRNTDREELDVELKDLSFSYEDRVILEKINLGLMRGSFISIVGPNGSGKSTMLKLMSAALKPEIGKVLLLGSDLDTMKKKEIARAVSFVPQTVPGDIEFTVADVVMMGRYPHLNRFSGERQQDYDAVQSAMRFTNTEAFAERPLKLLSGGERQRVILAQALAQEPKVLMLDEPVSNLDLQHQIDMLSLMKKLCMDEGITVIAILHDLNMATTYSDYVVMLKERHVAAQGIPESVFTVENIRKVFGIDVSISISPVSHKPYIYTLKAERPEPNGQRVHVICGGGSGSRMIGLLYGCGYEVTCGVVSAGDLDWKTARDLNMDFVESVPFAGISREDYVKNLEMAKKADVILVSPVYFGKENALNGELLTDPELGGKRIILTNDRDIGGRDYTGGRITSIYSEIRKRGGLSFTEEDLFKTLEKDRILPGGLNE